MKSWLVRIVLSSFLLLGLTACPSPQNEKGSKNPPTQYSPFDDYIAEEPKVESQETLEKSDTKSAGFEMRAK